MINAGAIGMPLHFGKVPGFLTERMGMMGDAIVESIVDNYGKSEVLTRMSDPCLLYTSPSPRDRTRSRMPSSA